MWPSNYGIRTDMIAYQPWPPSWFGVRWQQSLGTLLLRRLRLGLRPQQSPSSTGNLTGVTFFAGEVLPKRLELMRELVPTADVIAVLLNPDNPNLQTRLRDVQEAARKVGQQILIINAGSESDIDMAFATIVQQQAGALIVADDPFFGTHHEQIVALAARHALPTSYNISRVVRAGGRMSYGGNTPDIIREAGRYISRILNGEKPADLPVLQPTKVEFAINLKTAKSLGLKIPESFLLRADQVIE
jgi:putative tryptophan/tyrosine transport system substrate-binding protein